MTSLIRTVVARRFDIIDDAQCGHCGASLYTCAGEGSTPRRRYGCCITPDEGRRCYHVADAQRARVLLDEITAGTISAVEGAAERTAPDGWPHYQDAVPWPWNGPLDLPAPTDASLTAELMRLVVNGHPHPYAQFWHLHLMDVIADLEREHAARTADPEGSLPADAVRCHGHVEGLNCPGHPIPRSLGPTPRPSGESEGRRSQPAGGGLTPEQRALLAQLITQQSGD